MIVRLNRSYEGEAMIQIQVEIEIKCFSFILNHLNTQSSFSLREL